jgi:hypothetical protein
VTRSNPDKRLRSMTETIAGMREIVLGQTRQIDVCLLLLKRHRDGEASLPSGDSEVLRVILTMMHMVGISGHSVLKLTDEIGLQVKDAYPIARGIIEGSVNISFIMARGAEVAERADRHAQVQAYRDLKREWDSGGWQMSVGYSAAPPPEEIARLDAMALEFRTPKGREKDWISETLKQRLEAIGAVFPSTAMISLNASAFNIYRHASEVIHGSYYSAVYFWGLTSPGGAAPRSEHDLKLTLLDHQFSVLMSVIFAYAGLVECFANYVGMPELAKGAKQTLRRLQQLPDIADAMADGEDGTG